jgi:hypothetical protein
MPSITTWRRLEGRTRTGALTSLAARINDPLWLLARQWQSGELTGSDSGTPVHVRLSTESSVVTRWSAGEAPTGQEGATFDARQPLQHVVEAVAAPISLSERALAGRRLVGQLRAQLPSNAAQEYAAAFREEYPLAALDTAETERSDDAGRRWAELLAGRSIDGAAVRAALGTPGAVALPRRPAVSRGDARAVLLALTAFAAWWDRRHPQTSGAWEPNRLVAPHRLGASSSTGPFALVAPEHRGGDLDWHTYDLTSDESLAAHDAPSVPSTTQPLPTRVSFVGAPAARWWQFEDAAVDLGRIEAAPDDLARLVLAEFTLVYGNDFFAVPLAVPVGSLTRVHALDVTTTFGETITVPSAAEHDDALARSGTGAGGSPGTGRRWRMWHSDGVHDAPGTSGSSAPPSGLVMPPGAVAALDGEPVEDVLLARDESANVAWAIERRVLGPVGAPIERHEVEAARREREGADDEITSDPYYWLATPLPDAWLPLVPQPDGMLVLHGGGEPQSRLLLDGAGAGGFALLAIEVPSVGRRVLLLSRRARGADGSVRTWWTWRIATGRGESSSGLRFDDLAYRRPPAP